MKKNTTWRLGIQVADTTSEGYVEPVRSFNDDGIRYITGPSASGGIAQIKDYLNANNMLLLSCCSTAPSIANEGDNVFRLAPDDSLQGVVIHIYSLMIRLACLFLCGVMMRLVMDCVIVLPHHLRV